MRRISLVALKSIITAFFVMSLSFSMAHAAGKVGYVDLRRAFNEYEDAVERQEELDVLTEQLQQERNRMVSDITQQRDRAEMLSGEAREQAYAEIDQKLLQLQQFDHEKRQELLNQKNEMFREVVEDIERVVTSIGSEEGYDYILDSRYMMYARDGLDLTDTVLRQLNR